MEEKKPLQEVIRTSFDFEGLSSEEAMVLEEGITMNLLENALMRSIEGEEKEAIFEEFKDKVKAGDTEVLSFLEERIPEFTNIFMEELNLLKENA